MKTSVIFSLCAFLSVILLKVDVLYGATPVPALSGKVTGVVIDKISGKPVEYTTVVLKKQADSSFVAGSICDSTGKFVLEKVPAGNYFLEARFIGYESLTVGGIEIDRNKTEIALGELKIAQSAANLEAAEITAGKNIIEFRTDKKVINISAQPDAAGGTLRDVLQQIAGITVDAEGNVLLRGSNAFTLLINGKPTPIDANTFIRQTPASSVENVEIITNPSAKFDAEGVTGILNIIMKKNSREPLSGNLSASAGTGDKYSGSAMLNYKNEKISGYIGSDYSKHANRSDAESLRRLYGTGSLSTLDTETDRLFVNISANLLSGIEFNAGKKNNFAFNFNAGEYTFLRDITNRYAETPSGYEFVNYYKSKDDRRIHGNYINTDAGHTLNLGKEEHKLVTIFSYGYWKGNDDGMNDLFLTSEGWGQSNGRLSLSHMYEGNRQDEYRIKTDYSLPLGNKGAKLEAGLQGTFKDFRSTYLFEEKNDSTGNWDAAGLGRTGIKFRDNVYAAYLQGAGSLGKIGFQAGLRAEYTDRLLQLTNQNVEYLFNRPDFFPSAFLTYSAGKIQWQAGYSRRISRPQDWWLLPYPLYTDRFTRISGDPLLKPEIVDAFEVNAMRPWDHSSLAITLYYRHGKNSITRITEVDNEGTVLIRFHNQKLNQSAGSEINLNISPVKWFNAQLGGNIYFFRVSDPAVNATEQQHLNTDLFAVPVFRVAKNTRLSLNLMYNGPTVTGQGRMKALWGAGITLRQDFLRQRLNVSLSGRNIFGSMNYIIHAYGDNFTNDMKFFGEKQVIQLSLNYRFNNYKPVARQNEGNPGGFGM